MVIFAAFEKLNTLLALGLGSYLLLKFLHDRYFGFT